MNHRSQQTQTQGVVYSITNPNNQKYFGYLSKELDQKALDSYIKSLLQHEVYGHKMRQSIRRYGLSRHEIKIIVRTKGHTLVTETRSRQHRFRRISLNMRKSPNLHKRPR